MTFKLLSFLLPCFLCQTLLKSQNISCFTVQGKPNLKEFCFKGDAWQLKGQREGFIKLSGDTSIYMYAFDKHGNAFATVSNISGEMQIDASKALNYSSEVLSDTVVTLGEFQQGLPCKKISIMDRIPIVGGLHHRDFDTITRNIWIWESYQYPAPFTFTSTLGSGLILLYEVNFMEYSVENNQLLKMLKTEKTGLIPKPRNNPSFIKLPEKTSIVAFEKFMEKLELNFDH